MSVSDTSRQAFHELKQEGKITGRQELAFETIREFYEEKEYWPTPKEVHAFLAIEKAHELAQFEGPNLVKPRISELLEDPDDDDPDLLKKEDESRKQEYIEEVLDDYDSKKADPVKIIDYQSTLSTEDGEAAELQEEKDSSEDSSEASEEAGFEIPYSVDDGSQIKMSCPDEAIRETDDLDSVEEILRERGVLDQYEDNIAERRGSESESGTGSNAEEDESVTGSSDTVEIDGEEYLFDPNEDDSEVDQKDDETSSVLMDDGEVKN